MAKSADVAGKLPPPAAAELADSKVENSRATLKSPTAPTTPSDKQPAPETSGNPAAAKKKPLLLAALSRVVSDPSKPDPAKGRGEYEAAELRFREEKYDEAEDSFRRVARRYKDTPLEEDALFMIAECQYLTNRFPKAQDSYERLLRKYENSRHLDKAAQRLFAIGRRWLDKALNAEARSWRFPINLVNRSEPVLDREGRGLEALTGVRLHDPTGPMADDALMMTACYHFLRGRYEDADFYYETLRKEYPESEHQPMAHVLGTRAKLRAYQGADYDGTQLVEAEQLLRSTLRQFASLEEERPRLLRSLEEVRHQKAERMFRTAEYYERSLHPESARIYYELIVKEYPDTKWGAAARERLGIAQENKQPPEPTDARPAEQLEPAAEPARLPEQPGEQESQAGSD